MFRGKGAKRLKAVLIILFAVVIGLELGLRGFRAALPPRLQEMVNIVVLGTPFPEPWERAWIRNPDHFFILKPGLVDALQFGTPQLRFHVSTRELWEGGGIGFRNRPVDYFVDAVVLGDSFTFCFTERSDCWVSRLETAHGLGIVNLGLPVTGSHSHFLVLRDFAQHFEPPLVIWQFFGNDFNDDYGLFSANGLIEPLDDEQVSRERGRSLADWLRSNSALFAVLETVATGARHFADPVAQAFEERYFVDLPGGERLRFGQSYETQAMDMRRAANQAGYDISRAALSAAQDLVTNWDGQLLALLIPTREEVYATWTSSAMGAELDAIKSARLAMLDLCAELSLTCFDALDALRERAQDGSLLYYEDDLHLNPLGNQVLAELVGDWMAELQLLPS